MILRMLKQLVIFFSGRPFAVELINPRRTKTIEADMQNLEMEINQSTDLIAVNRLRIVAKYISILFISYISYFQGTVICMI